MNALRALSMLLLFGWTAVGGDLFGMLHECRMRSAQAERRECFCPHKKAQAEGPQLEADCCRTHVQFDAPVAAADLSRDPLAAFVPVELPIWSAKPAHDVQLGSLQLRDVPFSQGPPLFLKIRTLLI